MSRPLEKWGRPLFAFLLCAFTAWALLLPLMAHLGIREEAGMAFLYALLASAFISAYSLLPARWRFVMPLALLAGFALSAALLPASLPHRALAFVSALARGAALMPAVIIYLEALLPLVLLLLAGFARLLMEGDPAFTLPLLTAPMMMLWFTGAREDLRAYLPAILCLPVMYIYIREPAGEAPPAGRPRTLTLRALALALALALLAGALTPQYRKTQPQMERMADEIRRRVEDLFFFTATRTMFSLGSQGYQPMGEQGLGGRPDISNAPVMTVNTPQKLYLRGTALDTYTGRNWYDSLSSQRYGWQALRYAALKEELFDESLPADWRVEAAQASVTMLASMPSTLFVPQRLRQLTLGRDMVAYFNASSEVFITHDLENGDSYSFRYEPYVAGESRTDTLAARLEASGTGPLVDLPPEYTALPRHLQPDGIIAELAREITGTQTHPYRQALALMRHLKNNYAYTIDVPAAPINQDFAAHFLFETQAGYCTYFATAMTVLARSVGLPARYVEGFLANPQGAASVTLTGANAHAWTEVYIAGLGWVVFDATATQGGQDEDGGDQPPPPQAPSPSPSPSPTPSPTPEGAPESSPSPTPSPESGEEPSPPPQSGESPEPSPQPDPPAGADAPQPPFPWWLLLLLALAALLAWRTVAEQPGRREKRLRTPRQVLALYWQETLAARRALGLGILAHETPLEYAKRQGDGAPGLTALAAAFSALAYGRQAPDAEAIRMARVSYQAAWAALPWYKKGLLALRRGVLGIVRPIKGWLSAMAGRVRKAAAGLAGKGTGNNKHKRIKK